MNAVILLIIGIPAIEIYLMIKVGGIIGALNTILLIFFTAITGIYFTKIAGLSTLRSGFNQLIKNEIPVYEIISGAALAFAALLLIIPGFLTDLIGFLLIIPLTRKFFIKTISAKFSNKKVEIFLNSNDDITEVIIKDDGPGFPKDLIDKQKLGEPYIRTADEVYISKHGLGLGTFIGKTLLEKNYAIIIFKNSKNIGGAEVIIKWKNKDLKKI